MDSHARALGHASETFSETSQNFSKGTVTQLSLPTSGTLGTDSWMLQSPDGDRSTQRMLFQHLVNRLTAEELHLVGIFQVVSYPGLITRVK